MTSSNTSALDIGHAKGTERLPVISLLALASAGFLTILTEALPAGLLPQISDGLSVTESLAGQLVTLYAVGSFLAAIPLTAATQGIRRRQLLLIALGGFVVANSVTTFSENYVLTMVARFLGGVSAGVLWALLAGYAARIVSEDKKGRAIAVAMVGTPLALSLGVPLGTWLGGIVGWRMCFGLMSLLGVLLMVWVRVKLPDFEGMGEDKRLQLRAVFVMPGVRPILFVVLAFVLAHNILYTYIAPFLVLSDMVERTGTMLLLFGVASVVGIWVVGLLIDHHLRILTLASIALFGFSAFILGTAGGIPVAVTVAMVIWGLAFGGSATLFQTAVVKAAGEAADVAQSMLVTAWNIAIAGGGVIGGILLSDMGPTAFSPVLLVLLAATLVVVWLARQHGFPSKLATSSG